VITPEVASQRIPLQIVSHFVTSLNAVTMPLAAIINPPHPILDHLSTAIFRQLSPISCLGACRSFPTGSPWSQIGCRRTVLQKIRSCTPTTDGTIPRQPGKLSAITVGKIEELT